MENVWSIIAGDSREIYVYNIEHECTIFCTIKKIKNKIFKLSYKDNKLTLCSLNGQKYYELTYIPDRSNNSIYYFECKCIGCDNDLQMTIFTETNNNLYLCKFKDTKPKIIKNHHYHSYTRTYTTVVNECYDNYGEYYISKPTTQLPPPYY